MNLDLENLSKNQLIELVDHYQSYINILQNSKGKDKNFPGSEDDFLSILNNTYEAISIASDGILRFINKPVESILGYSSDELLEKPFSDLIFEEDRLNVLSNHTKRLTGHKDLPDKYNFRIVDKTGKIHWVEISPSLIEWQGQPAVMSKMIDITERLNYKRELRDSENKYRTIIENSLDAVIVLRDFKLIYNNSSARELISSDENLLNVDVRKFIHPADIKKTENNYKARLSSGTAEKLYNLRIITSDKKKKVIQVKPIIIDWEGAPAVFTFLTDITEHLTSEYELTKSKEKYKTLINNLQEFVLVTQNGKILFFNDTFKNFTKYEKNNLINESILELIHPNDRDRVTYMQSDGNIDFIISEFPYEFRLIKKDNTTVWVRNRTVRVDWENRPALFNFLYDISSEKKALIEVNRLNTAINQSSQSVIITDNEGIIKYINPYFTTLTGFEESDIIGKTPRILKSGAYSKEFYDKMWDTLRMGKVWKGEILNRSKSNKLFWVLATISPVRDDLGKIISYISIQVDITKRKKIEEDYKEAVKKAENADKLKSEFLAQMSHEIRTPINVILSFAQLMEDEVKPLISEEIQFGFESMNNAGRRIIRTVDLMLNMSEVQAGTYDYNPSYINLEEIMSNLFRERKKYIENKNLYLTFDNKANSVKVFADYYTIEQIFSNLLDNAIKYTISGGIKVSILDNNDKIRVIIEDTGIGIKDEYIESIFDPFTQEEQGYTRSFDGNGLGLALVKQFCDLNQAEISVNSIKNHGSTFYVDFKKNLD